MIHYILLPASERHALRREYRIRLAIVAFLFFSLAMVVGIVSIIPSYLYSYNLVNGELSRKEAINKLRKASGADQIEKDLLLNQAIAQKILAEENNVDDYDLIQKIISHRNKGIAIDTFDITHIASSTPGAPGVAPSPGVGTSTKAIVSVHAKAASREALLDFQNAIKGDKAFSDVDLPLSDLAQSKDIGFTIRLKVSK